MIKKEMETTTSDYDKEKLQERLAKLAGGVAQVKVCAATEVRDEGEEAPRRGCAPRDPGGRRRGILPGGGVALHGRFQGARQIKSGDADEKTGIDIIRGRRGADQADRLELRRRGAIGGDKVLESKDVNFGFNPTPRVRRT